LTLPPDSGFLRTLDSSIKRNTAVIKKLKQINEEQREGLMEDLRGVNLSKFVSEAVTAICDAKLRSSDIQAAVQVLFRVEYLEALLSSAIFYFYMLEWVAYLRRYIPCMDMCESFVGYYLMHICTSSMEA
jgi:hypothetical protein